MTDMDRPFLGEAVNPRPPPPLFSVVFTHAGQRDHLTGGVGGKAPVLAKIISPLIHAPFCPAVVSGIGVGVPSVYTGFFGCVYVVFIPLFF